MASPLLPRGYRVYRRFPRVAQIMWQRLGVTRQPVSLCRLVFVPGIEAKTCGARRWWPGIISGMANGLRFPELRVPAVGRQPALIVRPWRAADIPALAAEMSREYPTAGMWPGPGERPVRTAPPGGTQRTAPDGERDAARWIASQDRGWRDGDRLSFAVLEADDAGACVLAGNVGLKNREEAGQIGGRKTAEIGYWTAVAARGRGIAPAAVSAVTAWVFDTFAGTCLRQIMLVHDVANPASCRVAQKAGYPFLELSPASPPHWHTDAHIHLRLDAGPDVTMPGWTASLPCG
jgi:RimJ/RimL family protein N-acetyltransferase